MLSCPVDALSPTCIPDLHSVKETAKLIHALGGKSRDDPELNLCREMKRCREHSSPFCCCCTEGVGLARGEAECTCAGSEWSLPMTGDLGLHQLGSAMAAAFAGGGEGGAAAGACACVRASLLSLPNSAEPHCCHSLCVCPQQCRASLLSLSLCPNSLEPHCCPTSVCPDSVEPHCCHSVSAPNSQSEEDANPHRDAVAVLGAAFTVLDAAVAVLAAAGQQCFPLLSHCCHSA